MLILALIAIFVTFFLLTYFSAPALFHLSVDYNQRRQRELEKHIEQLMTRQEAKKISTVFVLGAVAIPLAVCVITWMNFGFKVSIALTILAVLISIVLPGVYIRHLRESNKRKFEEQLIDALMIMSSCLRAGLSLIQAFEAVVDEMSDPVSKEFGVVLGENKMGVSLEDSLSYLYNRMTSSSLQQVNTAILLARETGGNLPLIFERISATIRENKKVQQQLDSLTIQGKIQGVIMSILPIAFAFVLYSKDRQTFELMLTAREGQIMLTIACVLWVVGVYLIFKFSKITDY